MKFVVKTHRGCGIFLSVGKTFDNFAEAYDYAKGLENEELSSEEIIISTLREL